MKPEKFWLIVRDCMCVVHGMYPSEANGRVCDLCERLRLNSVVYDRTPFEVACSLAGSDADVRDHVANLVMIYAARDVA